MSDPATTTESPGEHPLRRRLVAELRSIPRIFFKLGVLWFALGTVVTFVPGAEQGWYAISAVLAAFGFLVPEKRYRIGALLFVLLSAFAVVEGHRRGVEYRTHMEHRRDVTPQHSQQP